MENPIAPSRKLYITKLHKAISEIASDSRVAIGEPEILATKKTKVFAKKMRLRLNLLANSGQVDDAKNLASDFYRSAKKNYPQIEIGRAS